MNLRNLCFQTLESAKYDEVVHIPYHMHFAQHDEPGINLPSFFAQLAELLQTKKNPLIILGGNKDEFNADQFKDIILNLIKISAPRVHVALDELPSFEMFSRLANYLDKVRPLAKTKMPVFTAFGKKENINELNEMLFRNFDNDAIRSTVADLEWQTANEIRAKDEFDNNNIFLHQKATVLTSKIDFMTDNELKQKLEIERDGLLHDIVNSTSDNAILKKQAKKDIDENNFMKNPIFFFSNTKSQKKTPVIPKPIRYQLNITQPKH